MCDCSRPCGCGKGISILSGASVGHDPTAIIRSTIRVSSIFMCTSPGEPMSKTAWIEQEIASLKEQGLFNTIRTIESPMDGRVVVNGSHVLNFCANNYLGLANHPALREAVKKAVDTMGVGPGAVRSIAGTMSLHVQLEER